MQGQFDNKEIQVRQLEISVLRVGNKQMTISVFNQLYEQKPFDSDYNLTNELWGKVNRDGNYVIFNTEEGIRKFNISSFNHSLHANDFSDSIGKALAKKERSFELEHMKSKLYNYFSDLDDESHISELLYQLSLDHGDLHPADYHVFSNALYGDFRAEIEIEYNEGIKRLQRRNELVHVFAQLPQLFIAV